MKISMYTVLGAQLRHTYFALVAVIELQHTVCR